MENIKNNFTNYWQYLSIKTACKLELFDKILSGNNKIDSLARKYDYNKKILHSLIDVLTQLGYLFIEDNKIKLTETGKILTENHPKSLKYACILWGEEHLSAWQNLEYTIKTGKPAFENLFGKNFFDFIADKPEQLKIYHRAMAEYARDDYENICKIIDFSYHKTIIDIGGGIGMLTKIINENLQNTKCYLFDRQEVVGVSDLPDSLKIAGDFFEKIPDFAQAVILSRVLHDWNDKHCSIILKNIANVLPQNAFLYIIENLTDKIPDNASILSLNMAVMTNSFERTEEQYKKLLVDNGFYFVQTKKLNNLQWIFIFKNRNKKI